MKQIYSSIILIIFLCAQPVAGQFSGGTGTSGDPFQIYTAADLDNVRNYLGNTNTQYYFLQTADIDLSVYSNWEPIGGGGTDDLFQGHYDGAGYAISNLTINRPTTPNVGLFGHIGPVDENSANPLSIRNVHLEEVDIRGARGTGALVGRVTGNEDTFIESCYVINGTVTGDAVTGGLVGSNNSYVAGSTTSRRPVINKCFANVEVFFSGSGADNQKFGGLAGCNQKGVIKNSFSLGTVTVEPASGTAERVGGLAGCITLIGLVENSYSAGLVTVNGSVSEVGGLVGSVGTENAGTVTSSYWDTETSGQSGSAGGTGATTADMRKQATFSGWDFSGVWNILEDESYPFHRDVDLSSFSITSPGTKTAGEPFNVNITNAVSVAGLTLNGTYSVVVNSDIGTEGPLEDGVVYDNAAVSFSDGEATLEGVVLKHAASDPGHILIVDIASILDDLDTEVPVDPADAYKLQISQQPATTIFGNFDDQPSGLGTIILITLDEFNNVSSSGLDQEQLVTVTIENDGSSGNNAVIGGTTQVDIQSGTATFDNINIDKEGEGYTLRFSSGSPVALQPVISELFDIENIDDLSEFAVALEDVEATIYEFLEFGLDITDAVGNDGQAISGLVNVIVTSDVDGVIHNLDVDFTGGAANLFIALEELGSHILAVNVSGIKEDETLEVTVNQDQSRFAVSVDTEQQQYAAFPFDLFITGATDRDGNIINSLTNVVVVSNIDGEVYNGNADIDANGDATIIIALSEGVHTLTVNVEGITHDQVITDLTIAENESGFIVAEVVGDKTAGVGFNLVITEAKALDVLINGDYNVTVTSDQEDNEPFVFSDVTFTAGAGTVTGVVLTKAHQTDPLLTLQHTLTVVIQSIDDEELVNVNVTAADASQLLITTQPAGNEGTYGGTALPVGEVIVETRDAYGNPSVSGLGTPQNVTASISNDASAEGNADLGGDKIIDIQSGTATFSNLTLDKDGIGYTIGFNSTGFDAVVSDPFDMTKVENHIGFDVVDPGPQVVGENFSVRLINARYPDGTLRNGIYSVTILDQSVFQVLFQGNVNFIDGTTLVTTTLPYSLAGDINTIFRIESHIQSQKTISVTVSSVDQSGFAITPGTQTAGTPFSLNITGATNKAGGDLNGRKHFVTLTSDNLNEGVDGLLFSDSLSFTTGGATIEGIELFTAGSQDLTVTIDWVTDPVTEIIAVDPAAATQFVIYQQPVGSDGSNNDVAVGVGEIILHFMDAFGNISDVGLDDIGEENSLTVTATISTGTTGANLGGTNPVSIVNGVATFTDLSLDLNGTYNLDFTYNGSAPVFNPNPVISDPFNMTNIENLEGFDVAHPGKQYQDLPFDLIITNAQNSAGVPLSGAVNVTVSSDKADGEVFNADATFTDGEATVTISLNTIAVDHDLRVSVTGITGDVVVENVEVAEDLSGFTLAADPAEGPFYQDNPFDLVISGATNLDGGDLTGSVLVTVTSDQAGEEDIFEGNVSFNAGEATIGISLPTVAEYQLTVNIAGITEDKIITVNVQLNVSGFDLALAETGDKTAGVSFDLDISIAINLSGTALEGSGHQVVVTSDLSGEVYNNADATFTTGSATIPVTLNLADSHTLTVSVQNITGTEEIGVNVLAAAVSKMVIDTQPAGGSGTQDDEPAGIGTVVIRTYDEFDNLSTEGLSGAQTVTVSLQVDLSGFTATLGGNDVVLISSGEAVFDDLTLNYDGTGYELRFTYSGDPALATVDSEPFDMVNVNSYQISLDADDPLVFTTQTVGYTSLIATEVQISNTGDGIVTGLGVALSGDNPIDFTVTQPDPTSLNPEDAVTFTVKPNDALGVGSYSAIVTVTADKGISEQFVVNFEVLPEYDITITHGVDEPLDSMNPLVFESLTEGYGVLDFVTVTITNTGGTEITDLQVSLGGDNAGNFELDALSGTTVGTGLSVTFGVRPKDGLDAGLYNATVTVEDNNGTSPNLSETFNVQFEVIAYTYSISLDPEGPVDFGIRAAGYDAVTPEEITVTRTGTGNITNLSATLSGGVSSDFVVTGPVVTTLDGTTNSTTFTVSPNSDLSAGLYEGMVTVTADNSVVESFDVTFRVVDEVMWQGTTSDWHAAGNWNGGIVPDQYVVISIPATANDPVISGANATVNELVIENGASLTVNSPRRLTISSGGKLTVKPGGKLTSTGTLVNNAGSGGLVIESDDTATGSIIQNSSGIQATVQRYVAGRQWHVISSPVAGLGIQNFITNSVITYSPTNSNYAITHYDEKKPGMDFGGWSSYYTSSTGGDMVKGKGYLAGRTESGVFMFSGELISYSVTIPITRNAFGWNAIGNPFPSAIGAKTAASSVQNFIDHNADQMDPDYAALYIYDPTVGTYKIINNVNSEDVDPDYIQSGQGFLVKSRTGGGNISFTTSMRAHDITTSFYKKSSNNLWPIINLQVMSNNRNASTLIAFNGSMTRGLDPTYDAGQYGADAGFRLYTRLVEEDNGVNMAIQALPDYGFEDMIIPVGFDFAEGGEVTFSAVDIRLPSGARAILEDRELDIFTDLEHDSYTVALGENYSGPGRFFVHTDIQITDIEDPLHGEDDNVLNIYSYGKEIFIEGEISENSYAELFDLTGKPVMTVRLQPADRNSFRVDDLSRGIYIIHVSGSGNDRAKRLFIE